MTVFALEVKKEIILATTTSIQDTGLLDNLILRFKEKSDFLVKPVAVGSGQAIQLGKRREADILLVHSEDDEERFVKECFGMNRITFMYNDFVILGPIDDKAGVKRAGNLVEALRKIARKGVLFVSRGDKSGTHKKELKLWEKAMAVPAKENYIETGQGMLATIAISSEKQGYVLADRSTFLSFKKSRLIIVFENDSDLFNWYSVILVNPEKFSKVNALGAKALFDFLLSKEAKDLIESFGMEKYGRQLFFYDFISK